MPIRNVLAASTLSLGLLLTLAATPAAAQPYGKGGNYSLAPAPRPAPDRAAKPGQREANCACPMTPGGAPQAQPD
jgi:hypothetical protein